MGTNPTDTAEAIIGRLGEACKGRGVDTQVLSSTRLRVRLPDSEERRAEVVSLQPDDDELLCFFWLFGGKTIKISEAGEIALAVEAIKETLSAPILDPMPQRK